MNIDDGPTKNFENTKIQLKHTTMLTPLKKSTLQECDGRQAKKMSDVVTNNYVTTDLRNSYSDICKGLSEKRLDHSILNDTRATIYNQHPALLAKLNNVASACTKRNK